MFYTVEIGKIIVLLRKSRKLSQEQLALNSNISITELRDVEHGRANFTIDTLDSITRTLEIPIWIPFILMTCEEEVIRTVHTIRIHVGWENMRVIV